MREGRREAILEAACRVIARGGAERLRMSDVAAEAGVSSALVHYYCATREELLRQAFLHADARAAAAEAELDREGAATERLERHLLLYLQEGSVIYEDWVLWREMVSHALFDERYRPALEDAYRGWVEGLTAIIVDGKEAGDVAERVDADATARRLSAVTDGLGEQVLLGILDRDRCRRLIREAIALEIGAPDRSGAPARAAPTA
jgi:AcrR family transcriptional regulator